jgi:CBS domain-containing protein
MASPGHTAKLAVQPIVRKDHAMTASTASTTPVSEVMHRGVINVTPQTSLRELGAQMVGNRVHCVVVDGLARGQDRQERLVWGIVSDLDLITAIAAEQTQVSAGEIASTEIITVQSTESVEHAARLMAEHKCTHLVVVSPKGDLPVGVVSSLDVAGTLAG